MDDIDPIGGFDGPADVKRQARAPAGGVTNRSGEAGAAEKQPLGPAAEAGGGFVRLDRRAFGKLIAGLAALRLARCETPLAAQEVQLAEITEATVAEAERLAGLAFTPEERRLTLTGLQRYLRGYDQVRALRLGNDVPPAMMFHAEPWAEPRPELPPSRPIPIEPWRGEPPADPESLAYLPVVDLGRLIRAGKIGPVELTELYLARLREIGPKLNCLVTLLEDSARTAAAQAEAELRRGYDRGPLHGIPWGAKDLFAVPGAPTTWGAAPYKDQVLEATATVVRRLTEAGAILLAKLSLGELAQGDLWYNGRTLNPWKLSVGSSGSSAGPGAATAAGLVGFALGTETLGSIVSPSTVCGVTGLRPTFGRVSRHGAMALSWTMDKIGPMARSAEDCALALAAIHGPDGLDPTVVARPFLWPTKVDLSRLRFGYAVREFEAVSADWARELNAAALDQLRALGARLEPVELPEFPLGAIRMVLTVEAAAAFDDLTRSDRDDLMAAQAPVSWPNAFRTARLVPAVEYLQAQRARWLLMRAMARLMEDWDVLVVPSRGGASLTLTNLTGHPQLAFPHGFHEGLPQGISLLGRPFEESTILAVGRAYQRATDFHARRPPIA